MKIVSFKSLLSLWIRLELRLSHSVAVRLHARYKWLWLYYVLILSNLRKSWHHHGRQVQQEQELCLIWWSHIILVTHSHRTDSITLSNLWTLWPRVAHVLSFLNILPFPCYKCLISLRNTIHLLWITLVFIGDNIHFLAASLTTAATYFHPLTTENYISTLPYEYIQTIWYFCWIEVSTERISLTSCS